MPGPRLRVLLTSGDRCDRSYVDGVRRLCTGSRFRRGAKKEYAGRSGSGGNERRGFRTGAAG